MTIPFNPDMVARVNSLLASLLDRGYTQTASRTVSAIARTSQTGMLAERLKQFDAEAKRLADLGEKITPENPVFRAMIADLDTTMSRNRAALDVIAPELQANGAEAGAAIARELALPGLSDAQLNSIGVEWNRVDPEVINRLIDFSGSPEWENMLNGYQAGVSQAVQDTFIRGLVAGRNPLTIARDLRDLIDTMPAAQANTLARTLQLQVSRTATAANYAANADILQPEGIRIETLDDRICISCVALHGTPHPIDIPPDEHWRGRAVVVPVVRGRSLEVQSGIDWFENLSNAGQESLMGSAAYRAYKAGDVSLPDFVVRHTDPVFGSMISEGSLKGILGSDAQKYYASNQRGG